MRCSGSVSRPTSVGYNMITPPPISRKRHMSGLSGTAEKIARELSFDNAMEE